MTSATGAPENSEKRGPLTRRAIIIIVAVFAVVTVCLGCGWVWTRQAHASALEDCHQSVRDGQSAIASYKKHRGEAERLAKSVPQGDVSDIKVINAVAKPAKDAKPATLPSCPADASKGDLEEAKAKADQATRDTARADRNVKTASATLTADEHKTVKAHLDQTITNADQTNKDTDGKVADNATRDNLAKSLEAARKIQGNAKATTADYRKAIDDLNNNTKAVNDSKNAKDQADQAAAQAQAEAASQAAAQAPAGGYTAGGYSSGGYTGGGYSGGGYRAPSGGGSAPSYTPPAGGNGGGNGGYTPTPHHELTQEDKDMAHHYECVMHPAITSGC